MAIKTLTTLFDFPIGTIIRDLSYDIERRLIAFGAVTYDLTGGTEATKPTLNPNLSETERKVLLLEEMLLTNYNPSLEPFAPSDWVQHGVYDYNDLATETTPINVPATETYVDLTNDALGSFTNKDYPLPGVTDIWDATNQRFDFSQLSLGDKVDIRLDLSVTTTVPNQDIDVVLVVADGEAGEYEIPFINSSYKTAKAHDLNRFNGIYMGDLNTRDNYAKFKIKSDDVATVVVRGWYITVTPRFAKFQE